jgi:protein gp37
MGSTTGIEWADATVNVWEGCTKLSPACKHCYAETHTPVRAMEVRIGDAELVEPSADGKRRLKMWGVNGFRYETANWELELQALNRKAMRARECDETRVAVMGADSTYTRSRVFINSLSDTFEDWQGPVYRLEDGKPVIVAHSLDDVRARFFRVAEECTELDLLLLTKRPENILGMLPYRWYGTNDFARTHSRIPEHIWFGTTAEDQEHADKRIPELLKVPAKVRFLSVEPLLGPVDLSGRIEGVSFMACAGALTRAVFPDEHHKRGTRVDWVIVGGESGTNARPMHPDWVRSIRDQCQAANVPFFFKQYAARKPKALGRMLDGKEWSEVPR